MFSIIYVNYKSVAFVEESIKSVDRYSFGESYEFVVVDNDSGDDISSLKNASENPVVLIGNKTNSGFGSAVNLAVQYASGDYFLLLNPDAYFSNNVLSIFRGIYSSSNDGREVLGCNILNDKGFPEVSYGNFPTILYELANLFFLTKLCPCIRNKYSTSRYVTDSSAKPFKVDYVSGALCCIPKNVFFSLGGFDPDFFLYFEETELLKRHQLSGGKCLLVPSAKVIHLVSSITGNNSDFKIWNLEKGRYLYFKKTSSKIKFNFYKWIRAIVMLHLFFRHKGKLLYLKLFFLWLRSCSAFE